MAEKLLLNRFQTAEVLGISVRTVDSLISANALPLTRIGGRVLIRRHELEDFIRKDHPTYPKRRKSAAVPEAVQAL